MSQTVTAPLERQFGQMSGLTRMSSTSAAGASVITLQFGLELTLDVAEQEVQAGDQRRRLPVTDRSSRAADLREGKSGRRAGADARRDLRLDAAHRRCATSSRRGSRRRSRRWRASAWSAVERRPAPGRAHRGGHAPARLARPEPRPAAHDDRQCQRERGERQLRRSDARVRDQLERPAPHRSMTTANLIVAYRDGGPVRLQRRRRYRGRRGERESRRVEEHARPRSSSTCSASPART